MCTSEIMTFSETKPESRGVGGGGVEEFLSELLLLD